MANNSNGSGSISIMGLIGVLFLGLKLTGHIDWPWVWVLAPFWIPLAVVTTVFVFAALFFAFAAFCGLMAENSRRK